MLQIESIKLTNENEEIPWYDKAIHNIIVDIHRYNEMMGKDDIIDWLETEIGVPKEHLDNIIKDIDFDF